MLIKNATEKFEYCISLGWFCGVASAMSRLGLRSVSGPFDWYFSDYWAVLSQLENDFQEFMLRDNLRISATNCKGFEDVKYGFCYNHDIRENFEEEYSAIYQKYMRRVERFREMSTHPTVFFRCIKNQEEIEYINRHWQYAENLVKSRNENSRIIYVFCSSLKGLTQDVCQFCLNIEQYVSRTYEMRYMFDASEELLDMCKNLLSEEMIRENKNFDLKQNRQKRAAGNADRCARCDQEGLDDVILAGLGVSRTEGIYLWGGREIWKDVSRLPSEERGADRRDCRQPV